MTKTILLYAATVFAWGFSWYAMKLQVGIVPPEASVAYRFMLAVAIMLAWAGAQRVSLKLPLRVHAELVLLGLFLYSSNFVMVYYASHYLPSGLVSVVFSTIAVLNIINGRVILGTRTSGWVWAGALLGLAGIAIVFWRDVTSFSLGSASAIGLLYSLGGTYSASLGSVIAARAQRWNLSLIQTNTWGMGYGLLFLLAFMTARSVPFVFDTSPSYIGGLFYLGVVATVGGFTFYLSLLRRIGPDRAAYTSVLFPVVALAVSAALEDFVFTSDMVIGGGIVLAGNILVLTKPAILERLLLRRRA